MVVSAWATTVWMAAVGAMLYFYIFKTRNYGGNCVGFRWSIGFTPLLFVFFGSGGGGIGPSAPTGNAIVELDDVRLTSPCSDPHPARCKACVR